MRRVVHVGVDPAVAEVHGAVDRTFREALIVNTKSAATHVARLLHHGDSRRVRVLVLMLATGKVVLERVHVRRHLRDLSEEDCQVDAESKTDEMETAHDCRNDEGGKEQRVGARSIVVENVLPSRLVIGHCDPVLVGKPGSVDVEGDQSRVHHHAKDVVASTRGGRT